MINNLLICLSTLDDCYELMETIRPQDKLEAERLGRDYKQAILDSFLEGIYRKTCLVNGRVAAMFGVTGTFLSEIGRPYFVTSTVADTVSPIVFARMYKREFDKIKGVFPRLENYVDAEYHGAIRLLKIAGFTIDKPQSYGPQEALFRKFYV